MEDGIADTYIRICDVIGCWFGHVKQHWNSAYEQNKGVYLRSFQNATVVGEWICSMCFLVTEARFMEASGHEISALNNLFMALRLIEEFCEKRNIDLHWHVEMKMKYNKTV